MALWSERAVGVPPGAVTDDQTAVVPLKNVSAWVSAKYDSKSVAPETRRRPRRGAYTSGAARDQGGRAGGVTHARGGKAGRGRRARRCELRPGRSGRERQHVGVAER